MGVYSTELREIIADVVGIGADECMTNINGCIDNSVDELFNFDYEIFDEQYRKILEKKILKHFFCREISYDSVPYWRFRLDVKMNEIMPYYNQLYRSAVLEINPLYNIHLESEKTDKGSDTRTVAETNTGTVGNSVTNEVESSNNRTDKKSGSDTRKSESKNGNTTQSDNLTSSSGANTTTTEGSNNNTNKFADTPQGGLKGLEDGTYLTNATMVDEKKKETSKVELGQSVSSKDKVITTEAQVGEETMSYGGVHTVNDSGTNKITGTQTRTDNLNKNVSDKVITDKTYVEKIAGTNGVSESKLLMEYRKTFMNIDMLVIGELEELFIQIW